jgi:hypothetical protein
MRVLVVGAGGVGAAIESCADPRFAAAAAAVDASAAAGDVPLHAVDNEHSMREWATRRSCSSPRSTRSWRSSCSRPAPGRERACPGRVVPARPFLDLLADYGAPHATEDR